MNLQSVMLWESGAFKANSQPCWGRWPAPEKDVKDLWPGVDVHFVGFNTWMGAQERTIADYALQVRRKSDWQIMVLRGWDHYGEPNATSDQTILFPPPYEFVVGTNDAVILYSIGGWAPDKNLGATVLGYYYTTPCQP